jgi:transcriptional regulator with XRE-family HTH domain
MTGDSLTRTLADSIRDERERHGLSVAALAQRSGVSRAMIAKVERGEAQPTAVLLARLAEAFGLSLSELIAAAETESRRLARREDQVVWTDPETGFRRRILSPVPGGPLELSEIELPPHAEVAYPAGSYPVRHQQVYVLAGVLEVTEGSTAQRLLTRGLPHPRASGRPGLPRHRLGGVPLHRGQRPHGLRLSAERARCSRTPRSRRPGAARRHRTPPPPR